LQSLVHVSGGRFTATACEFVGAVVNDMPAVKAAVLARHASTVEFRDCTFRRCQAGLALVQDSTGSVTGCTFQQNSNVGVMVRDGLRLKGASAGEMQENQLLENGGDGILIADRAAASLDKNECARNAQHGIHVKDTAAPECRENTCRGNGGDGICVEEEAQPV